VVNVVQGYIYAINKDNGITKYVICSRYSEVVVNSGLTVQVKAGIKYSNSLNRSSLAALISNFEPDKLEPDRCKVELKMEASTAYLYGSLIRSFMHVKEVCPDIVIKLKYRWPSLYAIDRDHKNRFAYNDFA